MGQIIACSVKFLSIYTCIYIYIYVYVYIIHFAVFARAGVNSFAEWLNAKRFNILTQSASAIPTTTTTTAVEGESCNQKYIAFKLVEEIQPSAEQEQNIYTSLDLQLTDACKFSRNVRTNNAYSKCGVDWGGECSRIKIQIKCGVLFSSVCCGLSSERRSTTVNILTRRLRLPADSINKHHN